MSSSRTRTQVFAALLAAALISMLVLNTSQAAFSDTTDNAGNAWTSGTVVLSDNDAGAALFTTQNMVPGDVENNCIEVTYEGSSYDLTAIRLYASTGTTAGGTPGGGDGLSDDLDVTINEVDNCTDKASATVLFDGTIASLGTSHPAYATATTGFTPNGGPDATVDTDDDDVRGYDITITLGTDTNNNEQGSSASASFTWEIKTNDTTA